MGMTGAGKGTQARFLAHHYQYHIINTGDAVRARLEHDANLAKKINQGQLADDNLVNDVVASMVDQLIESTRLLSDGYPRRLVQAHWFDQFLAEAGRQVEAVIYLKIDPATSTARLINRHRKDDEQTAISHRQELFQSETQAVLDHYASRGLLYTIDGEGTKEEVYKRVEEALQ